jgi:hypothetical protein
MKRYLVDLFIIVFCLSAGTSLAAERKVILDSLSMEGEYLVCDFHVNGLFDQKMIEGVKHGFTSEIIYHIKVWKKRFLFSQILAEHSITFQLYYDNWEDKFAIRSETERRLTPNLDSVLEFCSGFKDLKLAPRSLLLSGDQYYLTLETTLQPISDDAYRELRIWMSGGQQEKGQAPPPKGRAPMFDVFMDLMGFGDRVLSHKTPTFTLVNNRVVFE